MQISYDTVQTAYHRARRGKHSSPDPDITRRAQYEDYYLTHLHQELVTDSYTIGQPTRYIIQDPVLREIIALPFRDRIVQHIIHKALYPLVEKQAIHDVYSNMLQRGTLYGIQRLSRGMRTCSDNFTQDAYILKLDIQSFFLSIHKQTLYDQIISLVSRACLSSPYDRKGIIALIQQSIFFDYREYREASHPVLDTLFPFRKTMRSTDGTYGLPLGNLTSQLFANIYLHQLDLFVKHDLKIKYYGRYVDDFYLIHSSSDYLISCLGQIRDFLYQRLRLTLHPHKIYLQSIHKGVKFLGVMVYPYHRTLTKRTIANVFSKIRCSDDQDALRRSMMSYRGLAMHHDCYRLRRQWYERYQEGDLNKYHYLQPHYPSVL